MAPLQLATSTSRRPRPTVATAARATGAAGMATWQHLPWNGAGVASRARHRPRRSLHMHAGVWHSQSRDYMYGSKVGP